MYNQTNLGAIFQRSFTAWAAAVAHKTQDRTLGDSSGRQIVELAPKQDSQSGTTDEQERFGAAHPYGWNAAMCDGSVQTVSYDIDWRVHRDFGNRMDCSTADASAP